MTYERRSVRLRCLATVRRFEPRFQLLPDGFCRCIFCSRSTLRACLRGCLHPQGSVLGPLLFLLYVNDLPNLPLIGKPRLFADDTAISYASSSPAQVIANMKQDLELVLDYLQNNLLALNIGKTKMMIFRLTSRNVQPYPELIVRNQHVTEVSSFKYLGVHIDNRLCWDVHIETITTKCSSLCGMLRKLAKSVPQHVLLKMYFAFIHSRYQYAIGAWGTCYKTHLKDLQVQQNRCIKAIFKLSYLQPTSDLYTMSQHNILPILGLFEQRIATLMYKCLNNRNMHHNWEFTTAVHQHFTRQAHHLRQTGFRTEIGRRRFMIHGPKVFNNLPEDLQRLATLTEFKRKLIPHLRSRTNFYLLR